MQVIADERKLNSDPLALLLINRIREINFPNAIVYYNFPLYRGETASDLVKAHVIFVSQEYGVVFFFFLVLENHI
jgi:hypothetical protein